MPITRYNSAIIGVLQKKSKVDIVNIVFVLILANNIVFWMNREQHEAHNILSYNEIFMKYQQATHGLSMKWDSANE
jgi:hypothetical protein